MEEFKRLSSSNNKLTGFRRNLWELLLVTSEEWRPVYGHSLPGSVGPFDLPTQGGEPL